MCSINLNCARARIDHDVRCSVCVDANTILGPNFRRGTRYGGVGLKMGGSISYRIEILLDLVLLLMCLSTG